MRQADDSNDWRERLMRKTTLSSSICAVLAMSVLVPAIAGAAADTDPASVQGVPDAQTKTASDGVADSTTQLGEIQVSGYAGSLAKSIRINATPKSSATRFPPRTSANFLKRTLPNRYSALPVCRSPAVTAKVST